MPERKVTKDTTQRLVGYFLKQYEAYRDAVLNGTRVCSSLERHMVERHEEDRRRIKAWHFDRVAAVRPLIWMASNLVFPSGEKKGKPLKLAPWQVWITMVLFGWVDDDGNRRFNDAYIEVARKNGKSAWFGSILDYLAFASAEANGNPCYIGATSLDQAGECFERAAACLAKTDAQTHNSKNNKVINWNGNRIIALAAEPKDGKLPHGAIIDEYHQHRSNELINSITSGNVSDPNAMTLRITTAGTNLHGVCKQEHDKGIKVLEGTIRMDRYFFAIYTLDDGDSADDPSVWEKANPNLGVSVDLKLLQSRYDYSKSSAADMVVFKTKNLNIWVNSLKRWANMDLWNGLCCDQWDSESLKGRDCYGGLDLSHNSDFTGYVLDFPMDDGSHRFLYWPFVPEDRITELERTLNIPLMQWVEDGLVTATPGPVIDYSAVADVIKQSTVDYNVRMVAADRYHLQILDQHMPQWWADLAIEFSQGIRQMGPSTSEYERAYMTGQIQSNANPVMRWMMSCAESRTDSNGNVKIVKPDVQRSTARIDLVICSIMAYDTAISQDVCGLTGDVTDMVVF